MTSNDRDISIAYRKNSFCDDPFDEEIDTVVDRLTAAGFLIDDAYFQHLRRHNGGVPKAKYFPGGEVERFLNFTDSYTAAGAKYRNFNVNVVKRWIKNRVPAHVYPLASMPHGAFLCLVYSKSTLPSVAIWNCEATAEEFQPVADSFAEFATLLRETPYP